MERYFFHVRQGDRVISDLEGSLCDGVEAARSEAIETAKDLAHRAIENGIPSSSICVEIIGEDGACVAVLTVAEVLEHPQTPSFQESCGK